MAWIYSVTDSVPWLNSKNTEQIINNTWAFYQYFNGKMTKEAMAGVLGNMRRESYLNPGQQELGKSGNVQYGYGLIQWTPSTSLTSYVIGSWYDGNVQCDLVEREGNLDASLGGARWIKTVDYSYTWQEFCQLTDVAEATKAYLFERERAGVSALEQRLTYANEEYEILGGTPPTPTPTKRKKMPLWMMCANRKRV